MFVKHLSLTNASPRRRVTLGLAALGLASLTLGLTACGGSDSTPVDPVMTVSSDGASSIDLTALSAELATMPLSTLSDAEAASLTAMREEEQLAHDVYAASALLWTQQAIFANIADSEATHSAAVLTLLNRYSLPDPLAGLSTGQFATQSVQDLYDSLTATSAQSVIAALQVGAQIEEMDIRDITAQEAVVDNADILMVYDHLLRGSRNHLRAFYKVLTKLGASYTPQYITQAEFDAIVTSDLETGP